MTIETTKRRGLIYAEYRPPAPIYERKTTVGQIDHCPTFNRAPAYPIGLKRRDLASDTPGPGYSYDAYLTNRGKKEAPSHSLAGRHQIKDPEVTPGPGAYNSHGVREGVQSKEKKPTSISMAVRTNWPFKNEAPPPNTYRVRTGIGSSSLTEGQQPSWSLRPRTIVGGSQYAAIKANNPGPGSYKSTEPNVFKRCSGNFSMQGRTRVPNYNTVDANPGPGSYEPSPAKSGRRGNTLGIKHSEFMIPLITEVDCHF